MKPRRQHKFGKTTLRSNDMNSDRKPLVSIIMPVRNEAPFITRSLGAVLGQTYPSDRLEVIIADGMSTDNSRETIEALAANAKFPIHIVDNPKLIAPSGLNRALKKATGDIIIRIDGHCEIENTYVENCVDLLVSGKADGVGGPIQTLGETFLSRAISLAMSSTFGVGNSAFRTIDDREMYTDTVAFPGYTRNIIERAGAFDEELVRNQDDEYNYRIRELGGKILLSPNIRSLYFSRSTFRSLWRQYFQYGYWKIRVLQLHPRQMSYRQFVPFGFVTSLLLLGVLSLFWSLAAWLLIVLVLTYLLFNFVAAMFAAKDRPAMAAAVSLSFLILHFSYGLGSMFGLITFSNRWHRDPAEPGQLNRKPDLEL